MTSVPPLTITRDVHLMVASPLKGGAKADYLSALVGLATLAGREGYACSYGWLDGRGAMDRARNGLIGAFLSTRASHLVLVDGDVGFVAEDIARAIDLMRRDDAYRVIVASCPEARINWPVVAAASALGAAETNPAVLEQFSGQFSFELVDNDGGLALDHPAELAWASAGLMVIERTVIESLCARHPETQYRAMPQDLVGGRPCETLHALFQPTIDPASGQYLSGDMLFCQRARAAGFRLWLAPWMQTTRTASARFAGSLAALGALSDEMPE